MNTLVTSLINASRHRLLPYTSFSIGLDVVAGLFDFSVTGVADISWYFPEDNTTSTLARPAKTLTQEQTVVLSAKWSKTAKLISNNTDSRYVGDLSALSNLSYQLSLVNCSNITGDLSALSNLSYQLSLVNCSNITGDLSALSNLSYQLNLGNCPNITGDLSALSNLSYYLSLYNCPKITGDLSALSNLSYYLNLGNCSNVTGSLSSSCKATYINLTNIGCSSAELDTTIANLVTANRLNGTLILTGLTRTAASSADVATLESRGWTVTDATIV